MSGAGTWLGAECLPASTAVTTRVPYFHSPPRGEARNWESDSGLGSATWTRRTQKVFKKYRPSERKYRQLSPLCTNLRLTFDSPPPHLDRHLHPSLAFTPTGLLKDYDVTLPSGIDQLVDTLNLANFNLAALAPGCSDSKINFYRNYLTGVAVPPAIVVLCACVYLYAELSMRRHRSSSVISRSSSPSATDSTHSNSHAAKCEDLKLRCVRNAVWLMVRAQSPYTRRHLQHD